MISFSRSRLAAALQKLVSVRREESGLYDEITQKLSITEGGRLLDVGTGSGHMLKVIYEIYPELELFGLDISEASIDVAQKTLEKIDVDLQVGSIESTTYEDEFFDIVTCNVSMSYWENPRACFDEIFRVLKPGGIATLFEPQKEIDLDEVVQVIKENLADKSWLRKFVASNLNEFGLRWGRTLGLKLYSIEELEMMARESRFKNDFFVERVTLQNLPIFVQIHLNKPEKNI
jgi:ubiquinone/menaquinone biosynthesis C-methylase UbiE